ncbi:hypothetical protein IE53DRAFT_337943 [Violaceomyces palustris]|uniref:Uncharacterized protein n=1 Tax=Violaceomyces palustris TaxID=1673888 RepID=A0ACD0P7A8_9BASI|nr:hypothetical protein IE53DRAFT_337943 [Violaceomyces palustris]
MAAYTQDNPPPIGDDSFPHEKTSLPGSNDELESGGSKSFEKDGGVRARAVTITEAQEGGEIIYRSMSWQKCAALLYGEYVCLAILAFPLSFSVLGMAGGILTTFGVGIVTLYTSLNLWRYCMLHPDLLNICDIGYHIFGKSRIAYELTAIALILNNVMIQGLHTLTGAEILNTLSNHGICTVAFSIIVMIICLICTIPRKLEHVALMGIFSAFSMAISILLVLIFHGIQGREPNVANFDEPVYITAWAPPGTTFVQGFNAGALPIIFTYVGQALYPSFIAEMRDPNDFPKALYALTIMEFITFTVVGVVVYYYAGQYTVAPAVGTLGPVFKKIAFAFVFPTTIIIGVIYASVAAKYIFGRIFLGTRHYNNHTALGWAGWIGCVSVTWVFGWVIGEAIPFFGTLLSLMSALFDGWFGFIFWSAAFFEINRGNLWKNQGFRRKAETAFNWFLILAGAFIFGPGIYTSVESIIDNYRTGSIKAPFTCADNSL